VILSIVANPVVNDCAELLSAEFGIEVGAFAIADNAGGQGDFTAICLDVVEMFLKLSGKVAHVLGSCILESGCQRDSGFDGRCLGCHGSYGFA